MSKPSKLDIARLDAKGQVVIPTRRHKEPKMGGGAKAPVVSIPKGILIKPATRAHIKSFRGKYKHLPLMETLKEIKREEKEL